MEKKIEQIVDHYLGMRPKDLKMNSWNEMRTYMIAAIKELVEENSKSDTVQLKEREWKVGDRVRITSRIDNHHQFEIGEVVVITFVETNRDIELTFDCENSKGNIHWITKEEGELVEPEKEQEWKIGDKVRITKRPYLTSFEINEIVEVVYVDKVKNGLKPFLCKSFKNDVRWISKDEAELVSKHQEVQS